MRKLLVFAMMFGTVAAWNTGCSGDDDDDDHAVPVSIAITGGTTVNVGSNLNLVATATFDDATTEDVTADSVWTTSSASNATVGANTGVVTGVSTGPSTISATHDDVTGTVVVTVSTGAALTSTLTFTGSLWPHNGSVALVRIREGTTVIACQTSAAIAGQAFSISFGSILVQGHSYTYETFADLNADGNYDGMATDHSWGGALPAVTTGATAKDVPHSDGQSNLTWVTNAVCPGT